jgi:hypothetical protein
MSVDNLGGKYCFIVVATVNGDDLPAWVGKQKKGSGDREPAPWRPSRDDPDKVRRTEVSENSLAKRGRHFLKELRKVHRRAQRFQGLERINALGASFEMTFEFGGTDGIEFVIEVAMKNGISPVTTHG